MHSWGPRVISYLSLAHSLQVFINPPPGLLELAGMGKQLDSLRAMLTELQVRDFAGFSLPAGYRG
jgi:hypothetical protein